MLNTHKVQTSYPFVAPATRALRCLLLDDNYFDRERIKRLGRKMEFALHLDEADDFTQFEAAIVSSRYDVVMVDYCLPELDGISALIRLRNTQLNRQSAKVMITGDQDRTAEASAFAVGCHAFLRKQDMDAQSLFSTIESALTLARISPIELQAQMQMARRPDPSARPEIEFAAVRSLESADGQRKAMGRKSFVCDAPNQLKLPLH